MKMRYVFQASIWYMPSDAITAAAEMNWAVDVGVSKISERILRGIIVW